MNSARVMAFASILIIAVLIAGTWFLGVSPKLTEAATANDDREAVEIQNQGHRAVVAALKEQSENLPGLKAELADLRTAVPSAAALPDLINQLNRDAIARDVTITSMTVGDPMPYLAPPELADDPELAAASSSLTSETFFTIEITLDVRGTYNDAMAFVSDLQSGQRLYLVHDLGLADGTMSSNETVTLKATGQIFVLLDTTPSAPSTEDASTATAE